MNHPDEHTGLDLRGIAIGAIAIVAGIAVAVAAAWFAWARWRPPGGVDGPDRPLDFSVSGARLESAPGSARDTYFADKERLLHSWGWVDRRAGTVRIPIDTAMRIMVERSGQGQRKRGAPP